MPSSSVNIGWNKYETALLIEAYLKSRDGEIMRKDAVSSLSKRLRSRMLSLGMSISDTYRNENGIALQMGAIHYCFTDGEAGISNPSVLFRNTVELYNSDRDSFNQILEMANIMFPEINEEKEDVVTVTPIGKTESQLEQEEEDVSTAQSLEDEATIVSERPIDIKRLEEIKHVLLEKFTDGYRLNSFLEYKRMKNNYLSEYGKELDLDRAGVDNYVERCGIINEGRVYLPEVILSDTETKALTDYIESCFDDGMKCVYFSVIFDYIRSSYPDNKIYSEKMLQRYLRHINSFNWHFSYNFLSREANVEIDILEEVSKFVRDQGGVVTEDEVVKGLSFFPEDKVRHAFDERKTKLISCGRNQRFHLDNFVISNEELSTIESIIAKAIEQFRYIGFSELLSDIKIQASSVLENNVAFGDNGLKNVLAIRLENKFYFYNNIISDKANPISTEDCFRELAKRDHFTIDDVTRVANDCGSLSNVYIDMFFDYCVRIDQNNYVSRSQVHFDIEETDRMLAKFCANDYMPLGAVSPIETLPECGFPWNEFLLECYAFAYSKTFTIIHSKYFGQKNAVGGIVRRNSTIKDFVTLAAYALADSDIELNKKDALQYLWENQYISQRRLDVIDDIIKKAKQLRIKKDR